MSFENKEKNIPVHPHQVEVCELKGGDVYNIDSGRRLLTRGGSFRTGLNVHVMGGVFRQRSERVLYAC